MSDEPRAAFAGQIAEVPVVELLQTILQGHHTGIARFETPVGAATLWFREGALVDADMGRHHMEAAVSRLLSLDSGTFEVEFKPITRRQVIKATTAEMIANVRGTPAPTPNEDGVPVAVGIEDTDARSKRPRRQGVSWHPTGGGKGRRIDGADASGAISVVTPPPRATTTGMPAAPSVVLGATTSSDGAAPIVGAPAHTRAAPAVEPMLGARSGASPIAGDAAAAPGVTTPSAATPVVTTPSAATPVVTSPEVSPPPPSSSRVTPVAMPPRTGPRGTMLTPIAEPNTTVVAPPRAPVDATVIAAVASPPGPSTPVAAPSTVATPPVAATPIATPPVVATPVVTPPATPVVTPPVGAMPVATPPITPVPVATPPLAAPMTAAPVAATPGGAAGRRTAFGMPAVTPVEAAAASTVPGAVVEDPESYDRTLLRSGPIPIFTPPVSPASPTMPSTAMPATPAMPGTPAMPSAAVPAASAVPLPASPVGGAAPTMPSAAPPGRTLSLEHEPAQWGGMDQVGPTMRAPSGAVPPVAGAPSSASIESGQGTSARGDFRPIERTVLLPEPAPVPASAPAPDKIVVSPELPSSQTMTAGSIARPPASTPSRPGGARRVEQRAAAVATAIGMTPTIGERRAVADGARLDQQVEAARAAGLTGASAPAVVGRYEVLLRIARGGMGTVYLARITGEGGFRRLFALKVIRDHLSQNDEYVRMLLQEARIASRLHHPNVVGIVDIGTLANQHYLVMDYVEGCTFSELLKVHRRTRPAHLIIPLMLDALTGLHAAHSLVDDDGAPLVLVHCDFSPQNMLVGTNGICRITDFGIAKAANALHERSSITRGKPAYVSPEQVIGRALDHRSDVFSAGVVLWNALTGEQLFSGDSPEQTLQAVLQRPIPPPSTVGLRPPSCFDRVCLKALERDPNNRYQSAEQMLIDLRRIAIAQDFLAPSSDVGRWVIDTFGRQLELRRQAAGISSRPLGMDSQPIAISVAVPELGLGDPELTAETRALPYDYGQTPVESNASKTTLLHSDVAAALPPPAPRPSHAKAIAIGVVVTFITVAIAIAIARPEWIRGGAVDEYGRYGDAKPDDTKQADGGDADDAKQADGGATDDAKQADPPAETKLDGDAKTPDAKAPDAKAPSGGTTAGDAKPDDAKAGAAADPTPPGDVPLGPPADRKPSSGGTARPTEPTRKPPKPKKPRPMPPEPVDPPPVDPPAKPKPPPPPDPKAKPKPAGDGGEVPPPPDPAEILEPG